MKKLFSLLLIFLISFGLIACNKEPEPSNLEQLAEALEALDVTTETSSDITFPSIGLNDVVITWESSNKAIIENDGTVNIPLFSEGDIIVTVVASLSLDDDTLIKTFNISVIASTTETNAEKLTEAKNSLSIITELYSDTTFPTTIGDATITWKSSNTDFLTDSGTITRPIFGEGDMAVTLIATLTIGTDSITKVFIITVNETEPTDYIDIYYINDLHGAILPNGEKIGMAYIANFLVTKKEANPDNIIILSGGDMLQGSALSNYYDGLSTINMMNEMYFDMFTLGNHEFDWGLETVTAYFDNNETNGEAVFPLLGANVFYEGTSTIPEGIDPYVIIERSGKKIGIIGTMGYGLENSIATSKIAGYEFGEPVAIIKSYAYYLRTVENVDLVLVVSHDSGRLNNGVAALTGDYKVDAIFNAHSHSTYAHTDLGLPIIQSGGYGEYVGYVRFTFFEKDILSYSLENLDLYDSDLFNTPNTAVQNLIDVYQLETNELFNTPIIVAGEDLSQGDLTIWIARLMRITTNSDIAFHNIGGTRTDIEDGVMINLSVLYEVWPFDNVIKTTWLTGAQINAFKAGAGSFYDTEIDIFDNDTYYKVATNDYVFDKEYYPFINGINSINTGLLLRDIAEDELILQNILYSSFFVTNDILSTSLVLEEDPPFSSPQN